MPRKKAEKPLIKQAAEFVIHHLADRSAFAPFTGTDFDAWHAYVPLVRLWGRTRNGDVINALRAVVHVAQIRNADVMAIFKKTIPCLLDWSDERPLWLQIGPRAPLRDVDRDLASVLNGRAERVLWPCPDGARICAHIHSKPSKIRDGWFVCSDRTCRTEWRPDDSSDVARSDAP
jgi:hypothetical protein